MKDPYVYEGTSVLINNYNIKDSNLLDSQITPIDIIVKDLLRLLVTTSSIMYLK